MITVAQEQHTILQANQLGKLIEAISRKGYEILGPTVRDGAIVYDHMESAEELPAGWTDEQEPGRYRLKRREDHAVFGYAVGPQSWKKYLHPADGAVVGGRAPGRDLPNSKQRAHEAQPRAPTLFWEFAPVSWRPLRSRTACCSRISIAIPSTNNAVRGRLSSRCNAPRRRQPVSARRWERGRERKPGLTWR